MYDNSTTLMDIFDDVILLFESTVHVKKCIDRPTEDGYSLSLSRYSVPMSKPFQNVRGEDTELPIEDTELWNRSHRVILPVKSWLSDPSGNVAISRQTSSAAARVLGPIKLL